MAENGLNAINITQKEFNTIISESKMNNKDDIEQYFSHEVASAIQPITNKTDLNRRIRELLKNIKFTKDTNKSFSIEFGKSKGASSPSRKGIILKKDNTDDLNVIDFSRTHPIFVADSTFNAIIDWSSLSNKTLYFDDKFLKNPKANHSAFMAYLNRCLGYCNAYVHTRKYSPEEKEYISRLFATHMCKEQIAKGFPVLEGFSSTEQFTDFTNLNMLLEGKKIDIKNLLAKDEITKILTAPKL